MHGMRPAETAELPDLHPLGMVLLFLRRIVIPVLALGTGKRNLRPHFFTPLFSQK